MAYYDPTYVNRWFSSYIPEVLAGDFKTFNSKGHLGHDLAYEDANSVNAFLTERSNYFNMLQWQATNAWNKYSWDLQNEYNSPSAEMSRLADAGINPLWAMSQGSTPAQQLSAQQPSPNVAPSYSYEREALQNDMLKFVQSNALNSLLGLGDLDIKNRNLAIQDKLSGSQIKKTNAEVELLKSQTETNEFLNRVNSATYGTQVAQKVSDYDLTQQQIKNLKSQEDLSQEQKRMLVIQEQKEELLKNQIVAATDKIMQDIANSIQSLKLQAQQLRINQQNADTNLFVANSNSYYQGEDLKLRSKEFDFSVTKEAEELRSKSNSDLIRLVESNKTWFNKIIPVSLTGQLTDSSLFDKLDYNIQRTEYIGTILKSRVDSDPSVSNVRSFDEYQKSLNSLNYSVPNNLLPISPANSSVLNPSSKWNE